MSSYFLKIQNVYLGVPLLLTLLWTLLIYCQTQSDVFHGYTSNKHSGMPYSRYCFQNSVSQIMKRIEVKVSRKDIVYPLNLSSPQFIEDKKLFEKLSCLEFPNLSMRYPGS